MNPVNWIANVGQPFNALAMLDYAHYMIKRQGNNPNLISPIQAFVRGIAAHANPNVEQQGVLDWARMQHVSDPQIAPEIGVRGALEKEKNPYNPWHWNNFIEGSGREKVLLMAYEYFKHVYPNDLNAARQAAERMMGLVQVNYDRSQRPMMFTNLGIAGEYMSPFAIYRNAMLGNLQLLATAAAKNPTSLAAYRPLAISLATTFLMAGAVGLPLVKEWDAIAQLINNTFGTELPTWEEIVMKWQWNDMMTFGTISDVLGVNASPSMGAVTGTGLMNSALTNFLVGIFKTAGWTAQNAIAAAFPEQDVVRPQPTKDLYAALNKASPGILKPWIADAVRDTGRDVFPNSSNLEGNTFRTPKDQLKFKLLGKQSTEEARRNFAILTDKKQQKVQREQYSDIIQRIVDDKMGLKTNRRTLEQEYDLAWSVNRSNPDKVNKDVLQAIEDRVLTQPQKWMKEAPSFNSSKRMDQYNKMTGTNR
jgi:hypothetical protein